MSSISNVTVRQIERGPVTMVAPIKPAAPVKASRAASHISPDVNTAASSGRNAPPASFTLSAPKDSNGNKTLPALTVYGSDGGSSTTVYRPGDMGREQLIEAAREAAGVDDGQPCYTCSNRTYTDGSSDPGVSYKTPTKISPTRAASAVAAHEREHVTRNAAEASRNDRRVIASSVTLHSDACTECGKIYISGGTTRTTTVGDKKPNIAEDMRGSILDMAV